MGLDVLKTISDIPSARSISLPDSSISMPDISLQSFLNFIRLKSSSSKKNGGGSVGMGTDSSPWRAVVTWISLVCLGLLGIFKVSTCFADMISGSTIVFLGVSSVFEVKFYWWRLAFRIQNSLRSRLSTFASLWIILLTVSRSFFCLSSSSSLSLDSESDDSLMISQLILFTNRV